MALKFSLTKPTPQIAKDVVNGLLYLSGIWAVIEPQFPGMPATTAADINKWLLLGLALTRFTITFFHWDDSSKPDTDYTK